MTTTISGTYFGAVGTPVNAAGAGLSLNQYPGGATLTSSALVVGGAGYSYSRAGIIFNGDGGDGGIGVDMIAGGNLTNFGVVFGGKGGFAGVATGDGGDGGVGIRFANSGTLTNHGKIYGGLGGPSGFHGVAGAGGIAVDMVAGGLVINDGQIAGGGGGPYAAGLSPDPNAGGTGIYFGARGSLFNSGGITGGLGGSGTYQYTNGTGGTGAEMKAGGLLTNTGDIGGGQGAASVFDSRGGTGGIGVRLDAAGILLNAGLITGGKGGADSYSLIEPGSGGGGGAGIIAAARGIVINTGTVTGGNGGAPHNGYSPPNLTADGGNGIDLGGGYLLNRGLIAGGNGGALGGTGGDGVVLDGAATAINFGLITGGNGYASGNGIADYAGSGVDMTARGVFLNFGTITEGLGSLGFAAGQASGIYLAGGSTLVNDGTITGDRGGYAVKFGAAGSSRLIMDADARFTGYVSAGGENNTMELTGSKFGTISNLNFNFGAGFQTLQVDAHSSWSVSGIVSNLRDAGLVEIQDGNRLAVTGAVDPVSNGVFVLTGRSSLEIAQLLGSSTKIDFLGTASTNLLTIDNPADFGLAVGSANYAGPLLEDFGAGDTIDLKGIGSTALKSTYNAATGVLQVTSSSGGILASLHFQNTSLGAGSFHLATDSAGGSLLTRG